MRRILLFLLLCLCGCKGKNSEEYLLMAIGKEDNVPTEYNVTLLVNAGWRRLKGFEKLELVVKDIKFENGVLKEVA